MAMIPQRELRNEISAILRRAEGGERLTITVDGRPVAELGPLTQPGRPASTESLAAILADTAVDAAWVADIHKMRREDEASAGETWRE